MNSSIVTLSAQQLRRAADIKDNIHLLQHELNRILGVSNSALTGVTPQKRRQMSTAARAKIAAAQRARWAKIKSETVSSNPAPMSTRMSMLARRIWRMKTQRLRLEREVKDKIKAATN